MRWSFEGVLFLLVALPVVALVLPGCGSACLDVIVEADLLVGDFLREGAHELVEEGGVVLIECEVDAIIVGPS